MQRLFSLLKFLFSPLIFWCSYLETLQFHNAMTSRAMRPLVLGLLVNLGLAEECALHRDHDDGRTLTDMMRPQLVPWSSVTSGLECDKIDGTCRVIRHLLGISDPIIEFSLFRNSNLVPSLLKPPNSCLQVVFCFLFVWWYPPFLVCFRMFCDYVLDHKRRPRNSLEPLGNITSNCGLEVGEV